MVNSDNLTNLFIDGFKLRSLQLTDLESLISIWLNPDVTRFLPSQGKPVSKINTQKTLHSFIDHWKQKGYGVWAIIENGTSQMVGYCGLRYLAELKETEILYGLQPAYWGRGITPQAAKAVISYGFTVANLNRIIAIALPQNIASIRVIEKAGLQYEKSIHIFNLDVLYYSIESTVTI
ncbi:MAG: GNAT family N-acetyltransferase [Pleurocapsa sp.]